MAATVRLPDPPGPTGGIPLQRIRAFRRDPLAFLTGVSRRYGDVARFRIGPRRFYLLAHPDHAREVMVVRHRNFIKSLALQRARVLLGNGLLTSEGEAHLRQRRLAQPAFHRDTVAAMGETMARHARRAAEGWKDGEKLDLAREMNRLTLNVAGETLFGADVQREADEISGALTDALSLFTRLSNPLGPLLDRLPVPATLRGRRARVRLDASIYGIIEARRRSGEDRRDLLGLLLAARDEEGGGGGMDDEQLRDEVLTLFLAGHETTANALSWTWHLLAAHPQAEAALHAEVDALDRDPTAADVPRLPFTRAAFAESMRLYPPAWAIGREPLEDFEIGGYRIPAGTIVLMSPYLSHRDPRWWTDAEAYRPERWMPENEDALPRQAYFPFGGGPRKCIGEGFAWTEGILLLATLARRWRFGRCGAPPPRTQPLITLRPSGGVWLRAERRG